jgi:hypothetical protein
VSQIVHVQIARIESNPEQSKHLETARMKVAGVELDLVNLRSEKYADQTSRIPTIEFGTPEEDALRYPYHRRYEDWLNGIPAMLTSMAAQDQVNGMGTGWGQGLC